MSLSLSDRLQAAFDARAQWLTAPYDRAFRLFNGFTEGLPSLALEVYGTTLVIHDYAEGGGGQLIDDALAFTLKQLPFLTCALLKERHAPHEAGRAGTTVHGTRQGLARRIKENGTTYALELTLNRDTSLYLDTRALRRWAHQNLGGARVLNTFAYTGSLGVAAQGGGATHVLHCDLNKRFLQVAKDSVAMNGWAIRRQDFRAGDFFDVVGLLKREEFLFDCVFVDPPFFSRTAQGTVDVEQQLVGLINKVRPLVAHQGKLVLVNNALFVSGEAFMASVERLTSSGYLKLASRLDVDADFVGTASLQQTHWPANPAPFNHSTKVAILDVTRKDERK
jgi:23S rRNA (cytosine1962-C5)-methyltransferase